MDLSFVVIAVVKTIMASKLEEALKPKGEVLWGFQNFAHHRGNTYFKNGKLLNNSINDLWGR